MADKATLIDRYPGTLGIILGCLISMGVFGMGEAVHHAGMNPFRANAYGTGAFVNGAPEGSPPSGLQSPFAGEQS